MKQEGHFSFVIPPGSYLSALIVLWFQVPPHVYRPKAYHVFLHIQQGMTYTHLCRFTITQTLSIWAMLYLQNIERIGNQISIPAMKLFHNRIKLSSGINFQIIGCLYFWHDCPTLPSLGLFLKIGYLLCHVHALSYWG